MSLPLGAGAYQRMALACALFLFSMPAFATDAAAADKDTSWESYILGSGFQIPGTNWHLGGYGTASVEAPTDDSTRFAVDNLSLFLWWEGIGRWKFFSEFEYQNPLSSRSDHVLSDDYLSWERAYLDYALTDSVSIRAGKFLTPIGHWNLIHATPLVWTTSRPLVTTLAFPTNMTGVMATGTKPFAANALELSVYASTGGEIRPNPDIDPFSSAIGTRIALSLGGGSQVGFSYANFEQEKTRPEHNQLVGIDFVWTHAKFELSSEAAYRFSDNGSSWTEKGGFLQLAFPLTGRLYGVGRYENFRIAPESQATQLWVGGLNFRVNPALVLKAAWVSSQHNTVEAPDGLLLSVSVLL